MRWCDHLDGNTLELIDRFENRLTEVGEDIGVVPECFLEIDIDIRNFIGAILAVLRELEQNINSRLAIEVLMLGIPNRLLEKDKVTQSSGALL